MNPESSSKRSKAATALSITASLLLIWWFLSGQHAGDISRYNHHIPDNAHWITTQENTQYTGYFRKEILLNADVKSAYIAVMSDGGYELLCNGNPVGAQTYWRPTRTFQNGLSHSGQRISGLTPIIAYNFPREYQWSGHRYDQTVTLYDIRAFLQKGKNVIAISAEGRKTQPTILAYGAINTRDNKSLTLQSDRSWKAEPVPQLVRQNDWATPTVDTSQWKQAIPKYEAPTQAQAKNGRPKAKTHPLSTVPESLYQEPFVAQWVIGRTSENDSQHAYEFTAKFDAEKHDSSWLKVLSHGDFWIWINGKRLNVNRSKRKGYHGGEWLVAWQGRRPLATPPVLLDPDEASDFFGGERFKNPRHGDPTENDFKPYQNNANRTRERPNQNNDDTIVEGEEQKGRLQDPYGILEEADPAVPHSIIRKRAKSTLQAYDMSELTHTGKNHIRIRLINGSSSGYQGSQAHKFAIDACTIDSSGKAHKITNLPWRIKYTNSEPTALTYKPALIGNSVTPGETPSMKFMGGSRQAAKASHIIAAAACLFILCYLLSQQLARYRRSSIIITISLALAALLQTCFMERSELIYFTSQSWAFTSVAIAIAIASGMSIHEHILSKKQHIPSSHTQLTKSPYLCLALLLIVFLARAWMVHDQPIDDDEYASIQAILAIAETGKPTIAGDIWYSRSPLYHYSAAFFVKLFGPHIWSLRLYSVLLSVLTGWLVWILARRYFRDPWVAPTALTLFALHPFLIFSGHIARFYQQQQLMVILMIHLFIQGFIFKKSIWHRAGAIILFSFAVLSQEISIGFVPVFLLTYLIFGRGVPFKWALKAVLYLVFAGILITADILLFKTKCITQSVGVSPNVEATLAPTFWELGNLFSMFIGYSRLHLALSVFYLFSLIYSVRRGSSRLITLHAFLLLSILIFNLTITSVSFRYMYSIIPLWILLGTHGISIFAKWFASSLGRHSYPAIFALSLLTVLLSFAPWRIIGSYQEKILGDPVSTLAYVRSEMRPDDRIMITEPHPHAAKIELGRVDYDLVVPILYDFAYNDNGTLRDRNGNAEVVNRLADLQQIFTQQQRVWIILNREKFRSRKKNIRWEYPGAREELFIRQNCQLKYSSYLWSVYLWDQSEGDMSTFRKEPAQWVE